mmetsp:Transcript_10361/g.18544  ORF Transcript_10361/g.18544 Transcript_10361/m.18544 type:complete len:232 (+) Transcript_10361:637-1332(+)
MAFPYISLAFAAETSGRSASRASPKACACTSTWKSELSFACSPDAAASPKTSMYNWKSSPPQGLGGAPVLSKKRTYVLSKSISALASSSMSWPYPCFINSYLQADLKSSSDSCKRSLSAKPGTLEGLRGPGKKARLSSLATAPVWLKPVSVWGGMHRMSAAAALAGTNAKGIAMLSAAGSCGTLGTPQSTPDSKTPSAKGSCTNKSGRKGRRALASSWPFPAAFELQFSCD